MSSVNNVYNYILIASLISMLFLTPFLYINTEIKHDDLDYIYNPKGTLLRSANFVVIIANVYLFIKVAVFFYENFGAKQFNVVLKDKADIMSEYLKYDKSLQEKVINYKGTDSDPDSDYYVNPASDEYIPPSAEYTDTKEKAKILDNIRNLINADNIKNEIDPWTNILFKVFVILIAWIVLRLIFMTTSNSIFNREEKYNDIWHWKVDNLLLFMIVTAFTTELIFFFGIVQQYAFYGDQKIYSKIFNDIELSS